ncbi:MAG: ABC transporter ATP-binding protein [Rhodospirillales bacterium]
MAKFQPDWDGPVLECRGLSISYYTRAAEIPAVQDFNLVLNKSETIGLVGESGCGKSTVAMAIMRYMGNNGAITGGQVLYKGIDLATLSEDELRELRGNEIAMVYQEPMASLNPAMKLDRQLMEVPLFHETVSESEARARALEMLALVKLPDPERVMASYPHQISGGQQQRVVIAMALLSKPSLLLLDEPTTALDVTVEAGIVELIAELAGQLETSMIYISHNLGLILETCDRINVMYSGQVVEEGTVVDVFDKMRHPYTRGLFSAIPLPTADKNARPLKAIPGQLPLPHARPTGCYFGPRCDHFQAGRCDEKAFPMRDVDPNSNHRARCLRWDEIDWSETEGAEGQMPHPAAGGEVLNVDHMKKYYPLTDTSIAAMFRGSEARFVKANESLSFLAREAETLAIVGESGCGKSTLAKVLLGLETATEGEVTFQGKDLGKVPVQKRARDDVKALQMVFQNPFDTLNPSHTVGSQLGRVIRKFGGITDGEAVRRRVLELLDIVKLPSDFYFRRPRQLSGGQKQRVGIARAFAGNPTMVVADEPVSALDVSVAAAVTGLLMDIQRTYRTTLLFISHDLSLVRYLADRVVVMYLGNIVEQGTTQQIFSPPYHPYTEALLSAVPIADTSIEKKRIILEGSLPSVIDPPKGCAFHTRCHRKVGDICHSKVPPLVAVEGGHEILCHIPLAELQAMEPVIVQKDTPKEAAE